MPGKIKVKILAGRNLPVMDRSGDTTDAYVEIKFGNTTYKTDVCRKSLNPQWNSEWYKFEVEDAELQDEPLQIRLMDHDTYSANDAIGKVYVNLNPLLLPGVPPPVKNMWTLEASINSSTGSQGGSVMTGWLPVYDTMHGIRGEVNIIVKVELFLDFNKFRQSSCGVTFFYSPIIPHGYHAQVIHGFVEELVVSDDPEYKWIDKIRTPRASNEARQTLFLKLSNEVQRKIGLKALDLGGNAVIGYLQNFDLEGESGIIARGIGTVVTLVKLHDFQNFSSEAPNSEELASRSVKTNKAQSSDCSESEGSPRLSHQHHHHHHHSNSSAINNYNISSSPATSSTLLSSKFPLYGENVPVQSVTPLKVVEIKNPLTRQMSVQSWTSQSSKRPNVLTGSSLSLASDDLMDESLRSMLALEDMRGEPQGNRFSRGFRNLRYLPQNVLAKRSLPRRTVDSLDAESDLESAYSSTWSIDSLKPTSLIEIQHSIRKKKIANKKSSGEGMAALLIRSVHASGLPLDIVKEDRETPTPSPVNFLEEALEHRESENSPTEKIGEDQKLIEESDNPEQEPLSNETKTLLVTYAKLKMSSEEDAIPMITSSESDTSSSEEDDEEDEDDEPSESKLTSNELNEKEDKANFVEEENKQNLIVKDEIQPSPLLIINNNKENFLSIDEIVSSEFSSDVDSDLPVSAIPHDYRSKKSKKIFNAPRTVKPLELKKTTKKEKKRPEPLILPRPLVSHPVDYIKDSEEVSNEEFSSTKTHLSLEKLQLNNGDKFLRHHRLQKQLSVVQSDTESHSDSSDEEYYINKHQRLSTPKAQEKKFLINLEDDQHQSSSTDRGKSPRRVERTATVIYKGPKDSKEKNLLDVSNNELSPTLPVLRPVVVNSTTKDANHLQVPSVNLKDIAPKSPYPSPDANEQKVFNFPDEAKVAQMLSKKYRQSCMLDLIKIIDSKMLVHHSHSDSTKRRKHLLKKMQTPSPDSIHRKLFHHRRSRSRSPESISSHRHHSPLSSSHSAHRLNKHLTKNHNSCESLTEKPHHFTPPSSSEPIMRHVSEEVEEDVEIKVVAKTLAQIKLENDTKPKVENEFLEMHALKTPENPAIPTNSVNENSDPSSVTTVNLADHNIISTTNVLEANTTNTSNTTHNLCVSQSPSTRRHQHRNVNQENQQTTSTSPAGNQQHVKPVHSPATRNPGIPLHRRSSDSDLSITPKDKSFVKKGRSFRLRSDRSYPSRSMLSDRSSGNSLTGSDRSMAGYLKPSSAIIRTMNQEALEMLEYPFITMQQYPPGFVLHIGGFVSARSVKLMERINNLEETEGRDSWWTEIRMEVRSHARALACNVVIGYREETSISDDVCVLSGSGTAAVINLHSTGQDQDNVLITHVQGPMTASTDSEKGITPANADKIQNAKSSTEAASSLGQQQATPVQQTVNHRPVKQRHVSESNEHEAAYTLPPSGCSLCHLPYNKASVNFQVNVSKCAVCRRAKVPDILFTTVELPENLPMTGRGCFIQATVCKSKKDLRGELNAKEISDCLPFLEYELHSLLLNKLRVRGMNGIFGLRVQVSIGERLVIGVAVGTAVYLTALPPPSLPQISGSNSWHNEDQLAEIQKSLVDTVKKNMEFYQLKPLPEVENGRSMSDTDESEDELPEMDLGIGMKDVCVLEVDDVEDIDRISLLMDERPPNDFHVVNTESIPGLEDLEIVRNLQMFTQVSRAKIPAAQATSMPSKYFARLLQTVYFKLRRMVPCALCDLQFKIAMPEQDEIQLSVIGMALGLGEPTKYSKFRRRLLSHSISKDQVKRTDDNDMIFSLDEDHAENNSGCPTPIPNTPSTPNVTLNAVSAQKPRPRSPLRLKHTSHRHKHVPLKERYGVDITPLSYLPGGRIERYLGNLNFFFIRESNSIRENGGLSGFTHSFVTEVLAIVRAHITALGGNAMVAFFMTQCVLLHSPHKNQGQCLINIGGDVVSVSYFGNEKQQQATPAPVGNC